MTINVFGDKLVITFKYDPRIVAAIKTIPGRRYNLVRKCWEVPVSAAEDCIELLSPLGITPTLEVKRILEKQRKEVALADEIRGSETAEYSGNLPLFDFQKVGVRFLREVPNALLADVPGLGKTIQTIAALEEKKHVLVLCPSSLKYSWAEEIKKWTSDPVQVINGNAETRKEQWLNHKKFKWHIANYELLLRDISHMAWEWDAIVCDEATRISNHTAKTTKALKTLVARKRIALTGTPISNSPEDLYSIIDWISPRSLGNYWHFLERYTVREPRFNRIVAYRNLQELSERVKRYMLRRTKEEVTPDMPRKTVKTITFELSESEKKLYEAIKTEILELLGNNANDLVFDTRTLSLMPVKMVRLKQCTNHPQLISEKKESSSKMEVLKDILQDIVRSGEKVLIFTQFEQMAFLLMKEFASLNPYLISGSIDAEGRQRAVELFRSDSNSNILISTEAGGMGLNLQVASYVVHYDSPWSVAKLLQREDRAHRIGQTKPVTVYNLIAKNTIDEYVAKVLHKKQQLSVDILQDEDRLEAVGLTPDDIKAILRL